MVKCKFGKTGNFDTRFECQLAEIAAMTETVLRN
jgi:hypothetical protein